MAMDGTSQLVAAQYECEGATVNSIIVVPGETLSDASALPPPFAVPLDPPTLALPPTLDVPPPSPVPCPAVPPDPASFVNPRELVAAVPQAGATVVTTNAK